MGGMTQDHFLLTCFTSAFPDWGRFRGASYNGVATHDPLEQCLLANMLARSRTFRRLPLHVRLIIARAACVACLPSPKVQRLRLVCRPSADARRLASAVLLSTQLRRLLDSIPHQSSLWRMYREWTHDVAFAVGCKGGEAMFGLGRSPKAPALAQKNRLHLRGFSRLDARTAFINARPAYLPSAAKLAEWTRVLAEESGREMLLRQASHVHREMNTSCELVDRRIRYGASQAWKGDDGCASLITENAAKWMQFSKRVHECVLQERILRIASDLYAQIYALGLNAAERDYFFMLTAGEHVGGLYASENF